MIGGFTPHRGNKYPDGDGFLSENNGRTWRRYGKNSIERGKKMNIQALMKQAQSMQKNIPPNGRVKII